ncbi:DUF4199 domain-containing protein [Rhodohalobacter sp. 614A]|uniref:DUF4199 domain-containing protein n=1 Tax=Rhodohalobacter sp. 614A TaxID=2908649 RepID=UPI001F28991C|nr:DUF4199 domain-containing protein [Rhodohalobacter sp. 614A]
MKKYTTEIKWGLIFTIVALLWMIFERLMGWHGENIDQHATMTNLFAIPALVIYVLALLDKRKRDYNGVMTWRQGFVSGLIITLVVVILSPPAQYLTHTLITPDYFPNVIDYAVSSGNMNREEAEAYFSLNNYMMQSAIGALIMGVVTSAIVAIFTRKSAA